MLFKKLLVVCLFLFSVRAFGAAELIDPACAIPDFTAPDNLKVYASGAYKGKELDFQIDSSQLPAGQYDIDVYSSEEPVALLLGSYEPAIWKISWSEGTQIAAVVVSGYYAQAIAGLSDDIPIINSTYSNKGKCGYFYLGGDSDVLLNPLSRALFDRPVKVVIPMNQDSKITIGDPVSSRARLRSYKSTSVESYRERGVPFTGIAGIDEALAAGVIRRATVVDAERWVRELVKQGKTPDVPRVRGQTTRPTTPSIENAYVILKRFVPPRTSWQNHASYFVLEGVPIPVRRDRNSTVYVFDNMECVGFRC